MGDENKIRDAADAITGLVKAVPVYQDLVQPAAKELGAGLEVVAKTVLIALTPFKLMVWGYDQIENFLVTTVAEKLKDVPPERITNPDPHVVGPALQALRFTGHQEQLRELYANLLATSLDVDTAAKAHPAFVSIINSMSPDEARIMRLFSASQDGQWGEMPIVEVRRIVDDQHHWEVPFRSVSTIGADAGCVNEKLVASFLDNLSRLGLLEIDRETFLANPNTYEGIEEVAREMARHSGLDIETLELSRGHVAVTDFGKLFCDACVKSQGPE